MKKQCRDIFHYFSRLIIKYWPLFLGCHKCSYKLLNLSERLPLPQNYNFPVDLVYTWVNGNDIYHSVRRFLQLLKIRKEISESTSIARFRDNNELFYSLRSVSDYLPWIRKIFLVTDNQRPTWLVNDNGALQVIDHTEIIPEKYLPTFNSHVIEAHLHRIQGLAENFIYMNDDFFFARPCTKSEFFSPNGIPFVFVDWRQSRMEGYIKAITPHSASFFNTVDALWKTWPNFKPFIPVHGPHPQAVSFLKEAYRYFEEYFENFYKNKFRKLNEYAMYAHAAPLWEFINKKNIPCDVIYFYINNQRFDQKAYFNYILKNKGRDHLPLFYCINDIPSKKINSTEAYDFLCNYYCTQSKYEIATASSLKGY